MVNQGLAAAQNASVGPNTYYARQTALDAAIRTHHHAGYVGVVTAAEAYLAFLTPDTKEQN